ncbi:MAG: hypothetical protein AAF515_09895 [Pseudomonadota bacterium]
MPTESNQVFISCVTPEFERDDSRFPHLRSNIAATFRRADFDAKVQEDFRQEGAKDTIEKLDGYIRQCAAVVHLVGEHSGSVADPRAVADYLTQEPGFLSNRPDLQNRLKGPSGDFPNLTYTQWEALLALHHEIPLFVYRLQDEGTPEPHPQHTHLDALSLAGKHADAFADPVHLFRLFVGDIRNFLPQVAPRPEIAQTSTGRTILRHSPDRLFGRDVELDTLDAIWSAVIDEDLTPQGTTTTDTDEGAREFAPQNARKLNVYSLVAWGGAGKTSLVAHWVMKRMAGRGWPGVERYFDWSFYSQGASERSQAGADIFIEEALRFFRDPNPTEGSPWDRGQRLAKLIRAKRTLLVLDGIEPLQYPPDSPQAGELKDEALIALLQGLAMDNPGLCLVTTREPLKNLEAFQGGATEEARLDKLTQDAAVALLRHLSVTGTDEEMHAAWEDAGGHALTLQLLGRFLGEAHGGDIRKINEVRFEQADRETQGRTAMRVMQAYERWLASAGPERQRDLAVLRLTGLFDRPANPALVGALRDRPAIPGLTGAIVDLEDWQWNKALTDLQRLDLIAKPEPHADGAPIPPPVQQPLDAHPLVREYFATQLREESLDAFRAAHSRLFDYLCEHTPHRPDTLPGLQPLYQAVTHGCLAGRHEEARAYVYSDRIGRGAEAYSITKLGAVGSNLGAIASFFDHPWRRLSPNLSKPDQAWLLNEATFALRALGRLTEAREPMQVGGQMQEAAEDWSNAVISACNLSELELTLGEVSSSVLSGRRAIDLTDHSSGEQVRIVSCATAAHALHHHGGEAEARELFALTEQMQVKMDPQFEFLYSVRGFQYCELLLAPAERAAWSIHFGRQGTSPASDHLPTENPTEAGSQQLANLHEICQHVTRRATQTLEWIEPQDWILDIALDHLTLARSSLYRSMLDASGRPTTDTLGHISFDLNHALNGLRAAGTTHHLPKALLTASWFAWLWELCEDEPMQEGSSIPDSLQFSPQQFLEEAQLIAVRGPMPLYLADIHLHRARLFADVSELRMARDLIGKHEYNRRLPELEHAEAWLRQD